MTTTQKNTLKKLTNAIKQYDFYTSEYCFKELSVHTDMICGKPIVTFYCETGNKNFSGAQFVRFSSGSTVVSLALTTIRRMAKQLFIASKILCGMAITNIDLWRTRLCFI